MLIGVLNLAAILTWMERKQSAVMQDRIGANRASIFGFRAFGLFQVLADSIKMFVKEDFIPPWGIGSCILWLHFFLLFLRSLVLRRFHSET